MDAHDFDRLVKSLPATGSRRGVLGRLAALPFLGALFAVFDPDDADAKGRRKRRKKAHKHGKGRHKHKKKHKKQCKAHAHAKTCEGKCGFIKNNCKKSVDCAPCECAGDAECETAGLGDLCCGGACVAGNCCDSSTCGNPVPACIDNICASCDSSEQCPNGQICVDGSCEACAVCESGCDYTGVQQAIDDPQSGETILICPGTYGAITVSRPVRLVGAGDGEDDDNTILDARESGSVIATSFMTTVTLERLRITGGLANGGGAGVNNQGVLTMTGCTVTGNSSTSSPGGGILNPAAGNITMTDCTVRGNQTTGEGLRNGGGIINNGSLTMTGCTVSDNICAGQGGGIQNVGTLTLNDCDVENNRAEGGGGGGIRTGGGTVTLNGGSVTLNFASGDGGGIFNGTLPDFGGVTLNDCTVTDNDPNDCAGNPVTGTCGS